MAEDKKPDLNLDDWDSIPLDPDANDWDDSPASPAPSPSPPTGPPETESVSAEPEIVIDFDIPESPAGFPEQDETSALTGGPAGEANAYPDGEFDFPEDISGLSVDEPDEFDASALPTDINLDFDSVLSDFEAPDAPPDDVSGPPASDKTETFDPFAQIDAGDPPSGPTPAPGPAADFTSSPAPPPVPFSSDDDDHGEADEDFDAHLGSKDIDDAFAAIEGRPAPPPPMPEAGLDLDELTTKKVELDIDGIFLDSAEEETPEEPATEPEPPAPEPAAVVEEPPLEPVKKKIPKLKLLIIVVPALLVALVLIFGIYKFFLAKEDVAEVRELVIDPRVPPRDPVPGELSMEAFYIGFPGSQGDTLVEMTVVLHYNDVTDKALIEERLPAVRDLIFRATQGKGSQVISDGEIQKGLRQELADNINLALGRASVSYVQITQIRILH